MKLIKTLIVAAAMMSTAALVGCGGKDECTDTGECETTATGTSTGTATGGTTGTGTTM